MAVDTQFDLTQVLVQGATAANAVPVRDVAGYPGGKAVGVLFSAMSPASDHLAPGVGGSLVASNTSSATVPHVTTYTWGTGDTTIELVIQPAWAPFCRVFSNAAFRVEGHQDTTNRYTVLSANGLSWALIGTFDMPASGKVYLKLEIKQQINGTGPKTIVARVTPEGGSTTSTTLNYYDLGALYPLTLGGGGSTAVAPSPAAASASAYGDPVGVASVVVPLRYSISATWNRSSLPGSGTATISGMGRSATLSNVAGMSGSSLMGLLLASFVQSFTNSGYTASYQWTGSAYDLTIHPLTANDPMFTNSAVAVSGSGVFPTADSGFAAGATTPLAATVSLVQSPVWGSGSGVQQVSRFSVFVADASKDYALTLTVGGNTSTASLKDNVLGGLNFIRSQLDMGSMAWSEVTPGQYVGTYTHPAPGAVSLSASIVENISSAAVGFAKLYGFRVTGAARADSGFPALPWPTSSIPTGGGASQPSDVIFAVSAENGTINDLSQYGAAGSITGGSVSIQSSGSRTGDAYIRNTNGASYVDAVVRYYTSPAQRAAFAAATSATLEYDIRVDQVDFAGQYLQLFGGSGYESISTPGVGGGDYNILADSLGQGPANGLTFGIWYHIAVVNEQTSPTEATVRTYVNGNLVNTYPGTPTIQQRIVGSASMLDVMGVLQLSAHSANGSLRGGIDNIVLTARAKYTANFTPPGAVTGTPLPRSTSTLYLKFEDGTGSTTLHNSGASGGTFSVPVGYGAVVASPARSGSGAFLTSSTPGQATQFLGLIGPGTGNYTAEMWVRFASFPADTSVFAGGFYSGCFAIAPNGRVSMIALAGTTSIETPAAVATNTWHHIAGVRVGTTVTFYVNGAAVGSLSGDVSDVTVPFALGDYGSYGATTQVFIDEYRFTNSALYTTNFTPQNELEDLTPPNITNGTYFAGYPELAEVTATGTFNTQATFPPAYFSANATLEGTLSTGDTFVVDNNSVNFSGPRTLGATTCTGTFVRGTPVTFSGDGTLDEAAGAAGFYAGLPLDWSGASLLDDAAQLGVYTFLAPAEFVGTATTDSIAAGSSAYELETPDTGQFLGVAPKATVVAYGGGQATLTARAARLISVGTQRDPAGAIVTAPAVTAVAYGGHYADMTGPAVTASATGTTVAMAQAIILSPMPYVTATGWVSGQGIVMAYAPSAQAYAQGGHTLDVSLPAATVTASGTVGGVASASITLPVPVVVASGYREDTWRLIAVLPALQVMPSGRMVAQAPRASVLATGAPVLAVTHEAYVLNMNQPLDDNPRNNFESKNEQVTRYTQWPFTQVVRFGDRYFGVAADGLYELGGDTNDGQAIAWDFETCITDFKDPHKKTVASVYVGGQAGPVVTYTLVSGDDPDRTYPYSTTKTVEKRNHRQKFGLGRRARYYALGMAGEGDLAVDNIELELVGTTRRI